MIPKKILFLIFLLNFSIAQNIFATEKDGFLLNDFKNFLENFLKILINISNGIEKSFKKNWYWVKEKFLRNFYFSLKKEFKERIVLIKKEFKKEKEQAKIEFKNWLASLVDRLEAELKKK
jgi:hypothetical protein